MDKHQDSTHNESEADRRERIYRNANAMRAMSAEAHRIAELCAAMAQQSESELCCFKQTVFWTDIFGDVEEVTAESTSPRDAIIRAFVKAQICGWTPKKWWQFWRWYDTPDMRKTLKFYGQKP